MRIALQESVMRILGAFLCCIGIATPGFAGQGPNQNTGPASGFGAPCVAGQYSMSGYLLVCSDAGTFRYALPDDIPPAPAGGYVERPAWYPRLADVFRASNPPACPITGRVTFTNPIVKLSDLSITVPQGIMVGDHVTPIDHGYIGVRPLAIPTAAKTDADYVPIYAPADGEIIEISLLGSPRSIRIVFANGCDTYTVFMVVNRLSGALAHLQDDLMATGRLNPNLRLLAGEEFGEQRDNPIDFAVNVGASWLRGFASPYAYAEGEAWKPYTVDPWPYFSPDLEAAFQATLQRVFAPRWGIIDQDVPGTAAGNWYLNGTAGYSGRTVETLRSTTTALQGGPVPGKLAASWSHLAIARHAVQPASWIFSIGWWKDERGDPGQWLINVAPGQPAPSALTVDSGAVVYRLQRIGTSAPSPGDSKAPMPINYDVVGWSTEGIVAMQVNADGTLAIEVVPGGQDPASFAGFSSAKRLYRR